MEIKMDINWPEILIAGTIFTVIGSLITIFIVPRIESLRKKRKDDSILRKQAADEEFRELVARLAADPVLFSAISRSRMVDIVRGTVAALLLVVISMLIDSIVYAFGAVLLAAALIQIVPIALSVKSLSDVTRAVATALESP